MFTKSVKQIYILSVNKFDCYNKNNHFKCPKWKKKFNKNDINLYANKSIKRLFIANSKHKNSGKNTCHPSIS